MNAFPFVVVQGIRVFIHAIATIDFIPGEDPVDHDMVIQLVTGRELQVRGLACEVILGEIERSIGCEDQRMS